MSNLPVDSNSKLKKSIKDVGESLKEKMNEVKAEGHKLIDKAKHEADQIAKKIEEVSERAANTKIVVMARAAFQKSLNHVSRWRLLPVKKIVCISIAGEVHYIYGYVQPQLGGTVAVKDAYLLSYGADDLPKYSFASPVEADFIGTPIIPKSAIVMIMDTSALGRKHLDDMLG